MQGESIRLDLPDPRVHPVPLRSAGLVRHQELLIFLVNTDLAAAWSLCPPHQPFQSHFFPTAREVLPQLISQQSVPGLKPALANPAPGVFQLLVWHSELLTYGLTQLPCLIAGLDVCLP